MVRHSGLRFFLGEMDCKLGGGYGGYLTGGLVDSS